MVTGPESAPLLSTLTRPFFLRSRPSATILSSVNSVPGCSARISATRSRPMTVYSVRKMLLKPRLGRRRCSGIWPPSKPRMRDEPEREPWPLWPRVAVLPIPEPIPRPTRFLFSFAFLGGRRLERLRIAIVFLAITPVSSTVTLDRLACNVPKLAPAAGENDGRRPGPPATATRQSDLGAGPSRPCHGSRACPHARRFG